MQRILALLCLILAFTLSQEIQPTPFAVNVARYRASGTLNITCLGAGNTSAPAGIRSIMTDIATNQTVGVYNGTFYNEVDDDESFTRVVQQLNSTANSMALSNFLAVALRVEGDDILDRIVFLTRYDTVGGYVDPATCTADNVGEVFNVPFEASYGFYRSGAPFTDATFANLKTSARATGTLQYTCTNGTFVGPSGINSTMTELDDDDVIGIYNGSFVSNDGSRTSVTAGSATNYNVAPGAALSYFLARASPVAGNRLFDGISYIARFDTVGGVPQSTDVCVEGQAITKTFAASYNFYTATNVTSSSTVSSVSGSSSTVSINTQDVTVIRSDASLLSLSFVLIAALFALL